MIGGQLEEVPVSIVERAARADAGDQHPVGVIETGSRQREEDGRVRVLIMRPSGERAETLLEIGDDRGLARSNDLGQTPDVARIRGEVRRLDACRMAGRNADGAHAPADRPVALKQVDEGERHVDGIGAEDLRGVHTRLFRCRRVGRATRELAQRREATLAFDAPRRFRNHRQHAAHAAAFVADRAVRQREPAILQVAVPIQRQQPVVDREGFPPADALELGADHRPDFGKDLGPWSAQRGRMFRAENRPVPVVVEETELGSPRDDHGKARFEHDAEGGAQALRPVGH